ncbi:acetoin utilization deacetylase AcuC-like enzyme [Alteromonadaceae bacterium 2753L.S.0a.02]|nr:acetoin utilization deacetylase AcuC-like enzyme [Alteromonadaceae bacterium 2753L.S.0a.02]
MTTAYITHPDCIKHDMGCGHPESPQRLAAINDALIAQRIMDFLRHVDAEPALREQLLLAHSEEHVAHVFATSPEQGLAALDPDTSMNPDSLRAALLAAGAVVQAVDLVMSGVVKNAFCAVRPPGHHAERERAMGFCLFNNIAVGVAHALQKYDLKRVAVVDFDVHHGNGTEDIFRREKRVLLCSTFQSPFYPYSYGESQAGHLLNLPLVQGTGSEGFQEVVEQRLLPELDLFAPEFIFISAGFDAHKLDPLAQMALSESDYRWVTLKLKELAAKHARKRIVSSLEGGYDLQALAASVCAHISSLAGLDV